MFDDEEAGRVDFMILVRTDGFLSHWTQINAFSALKKSLSESFPHYTFAIHSQNTDSGAIVGVHPIKWQNKDGSYSSRVIGVEQSILDRIGLISFDIIWGTEDAALRKFRERLDKCENGLEEFRRRPSVVSEFVHEIVQLYGVVVETDIAFLMAANHFGEIAKEKPGSQVTFARNKDIRAGAWGMPAQYITTAGALLSNFSFGGRNRIIRNRSIVLFLYELWEGKYRRTIASACGLSKNEILSEFFGDLRNYRNDIAHGSSVLSKATKAISFVQPGDLISLTEHMDALFYAAIAEMNRISLTYFQVTTNFTLDNMLPGLAIWRGPSWSSAYQPPPE